MTRMIKKVTEEERQLIERVYFTSIEDATIIAENHEPSKKAAIRYEIGFLS